MRPTHSDGALKAVGVMAGGPADLAIWRLGSTAASDLPCKAAATDLALAVRAPRSPRPHFSCRYFSKLVCVEDF